MVELIEMAHVLDQVDVCVIGAGGGGAVAAKHLTDANLNVVVLEAGRRFEPKDFNDLKFDMTFNKFRPKDMVLEIKPYMVGDDNVTPLPGGFLPFIPNELGIVLESRGVGGTTLEYSACHPRAYHEALEEWDILQSIPNGTEWKHELVGYYEKMENDLPVVRAPMGYGSYDTKNAILLVGARNYQGVVDDPSLPTEIPMFDPDQYDPNFQNQPGGYRGVPSAVTTGCWHCGNCYVGCNRPINMGMEDKVKRGTYASMIPQAEKRGLEVRPQSVALGVFHSDNDQVPHLVVYGNYSLDTRGQHQENQAGVPVFDSLSIQPCNRVVLAAGATQTPRIWLQSNWLLNQNWFYNSDPQNQGLFQQLLWTTAAYFLALDPNDLGNHSAISELFQQMDEALVKKDKPELYTLPSDLPVGKYYRIHRVNGVIGVFDKPVEMWIGQVQGTRVDVPGLGMIESLFLTPLDLSILTLKNDSFDPAYGNFYQFSGPKFGVEAKEALKNYKNMVVLGINAVDDEVSSHNKLFLDTQKRQKYFITEFGREYELPIPAMQWVGGPATKDRSVKLTKIAIEILKHVEDTSELKLVGVVNNKMESAFVTHNLGLMSMGKVVDANCEAIGAKGIYVADTTVLPNGLGGPNPAHTLQALALRTSEALASALLSDAQWNDWKEKVATSKDRFAK